MEIQIAQKMNQARELKRLGRFAESIQLYRELIRIHPTTPALYYNVAKVYAAAHDLPNAISNYMKTLHFEAAMAIREGKTFEDLPKPFRVKLCSYHMYGDGVMYDPNTSLHLGFALIGYTGLSYAMFPWFDEYMITYYESLRGTERQVLPEVDGQFNAAGAVFGAENLDWKSIGRADNLGVYDDIHSMSIQGFETML